MVKRTDQSSELYNVLNVQVTTVRRTITEYLEEIFSKMSTTANINLNELYFEYKVLTKITGEPTFDKLHVMFRKLKDPPPVDLLYDDCTRNHTMKKYMSYGVNFWQKSLLYQGKFLELFDENSYFKPIVSYL